MEKIISYSTFMKMTKIINLTPHTLNIIGYGEIVSSGIARANVVSMQIDTINGIPVYSSKYGEVEGLPSPEKDTIYVVSALTAQSCKDRNDIYITNEAIRNESGQVIGCKSLAKI
jgi:hypothetical protein